MSLSIINNFTGTLQGGATLVGKQGLAANGMADTYSPTITGLGKQFQSQLATATVVTVYDNSVDSLAAFIYLHYWADQATYIQLITAATNVKIKLGAYIPFSFGGYCTMLAAASTSAITGGSEPATVAIAKVVLGNYSGTTANLVFTIFD